jgi:hypothetical protein
MASPDSQLHAAPRSQDEGSTNADPGVPDPQVTGDIVTAEPATPRPSTQPSHDDIRLDDGLVANTHNGLLKNQFSVVGDVVLPPLVDQTGSSLALPPISDLTRQIDAGRCDLEVTSGDQMELTPPGPQTCRRTEFSMRDLISPSWDSQIMRGSDPELDTLMLLPPANLEGMGFDQNAMDYMPSVNYDCMGFDPNPIDYVHFDGTEFLNPMDHMPPVNHDDMAFEGM